jgi:hypothetical protein
MTTITSPNLVWGPAAGMRVVPTNAESTFALNDNNNSVSTRFVVPRDGTIDRVGVYVTAVTGSPPAYKVGLVTVDTSGGPTSTAYGESALQSYTFSSTGWVWVTLDTPAECTAGDLVAALIAPDLADGTPSGADCITVRDPAIVTNTQTPSDPRYSNIFWSAQAGLTLGVMYDTGVVALPAVTAQYLDYDSASTPDEAGALVQLPFDASCTGAVICVRPESVIGDFTVRLYSGSSVVASWSADASQHGGNANQILFISWDAVSLTANTDYRLVVLPGANDVDLTMIYCNETASRTWFCEGTRWQMTQRTDAGAWTETATALPMMALILDSFELPSAGTAAGTATGWAGGMMIG